MIYSDSGVLKCGESLKFKVRFSLCVLRAVVARCQPRSRRIPGSKPDSIEDPSWTGPVQTMLQFFIICAFIFINDVLTEDCEAEDQYSWSYHGPSNGPYYWEDNYPDCRKKDQSPIEIRDIDIINLGLPKLQYNGFNTPITKATVRNVGWTGKLHFSFVIATTTALATINRMDYTSVSQGVTHAPQGNNSKMDSSRVENATRSHEIDKSSFNPDTF
ncbi:hypothetical protein AVEN_203224-1 [Araneus ventricosus]|uniref:Alpha-carbonic anhydrase domain-containing protein n=1 Tax=Araneus ventricosus TaxID=182803 RepID=A0A4Y2F0K2_ARAVE|nr:hypothetical protein AVEN_203224-1 [Araneus ventricosus]